MIHSTYPRGRAPVAALLATLLALAGAGRASADVMEVTYDSRGAGIISTVRYDGQDVGAFIGEFNMHLNSGPGFAVRGPEFESFCVDLDHDMHAGLSYLVQPRSTGDGLPQGPQIAYLYNTYAQSPLSNDQAAGLQIALWKLVTDGDGPLTSGRFEYLQNDAAAGWAQTYLAVALSHTGQGGWLDASPGDKTGPRGQSVLAPPGLVKVLVDPTDPVTVPEPSSALLVGLGLAGAVVRRWFVRRKLSKFGVTGERG